MSIVPKGSAVCVVAAWLRARCLILEFDFRFCDGAEEVPELAEEERLVVELLDSAVTALAEGAVVEAQIGKRKNKN